MKRLRRHLTYANVMATIAVFIALGGSSYAALRIGSKDIVDGSIRGVDVRKNSLGGAHIAEKSLGRVPRARRADSLTKKGADRLRVACPEGTVFASGVCVDEVSRPPTPFAFAMRDCSAANVGNRRLPTISELMAFSGQGGRIHPAGEYTSDAAGGGAATGLAVVVVKPDSEFDTVHASAFHPYRCVTNPTNR